MEGLYAYLALDNDRLADPRLRLRYVSSYLHPERSGTGTLLMLAAISWFACVEAVRMHWSAGDDGSRIFHEKLIDRYGPTLEEQDIRINRSNAYLFALDKDRP